MVEAPCFTILGSSIHHSDILHSSIQHVHPVVAKSSYRIGMVCSDPPWNPAKHGGLHLSKLGGHGPQGPQGPHRQGDTGEFPLGSVAPETEEEMLQQCHRKALRKTRSSGAAVAGLSVEGFNQKMVCVCVYVYNCILYCRILISVRTPSPTFEGVSLG